MTSTTTAIANPSNPLTITLPDWVDTNETYQLVWDAVNEEWTVLPF